MRILIIYAKQCEDLMFSVMWFKLSATIPKWFIWRHPPNISYQCDTNKLMSGKRNGIDRIGFVLFIRLWWLTLIFGDQGGKHCVREHIGGSQQMQQGCRCDDLSVSLSVCPFNVLMTWYSLYLYYFMLNKSCLSLSLVSNATVTKIQIL